MRKEKIMQIRKVIIISVLFIFVASSAILLASAQPIEEQEGSLASGYYVTSDWHGIDTPLGTDIHVTAKTTDAGVTYVTFIWRNGAGDTIYGPDVVTTRGTDGTYGGATVYVFEAPVHAPDSIGDWGVQAIFQGPDGSARANLENVIAIRATSFNVIPEIPLLGTLGASIVMMAGLWWFKLRRKTQIVK
jgi:hypothetical protein